MAGSTHHRNPESTTAGSDPPRLAERVRAELLTLRHERDILWGERTQLHEQLRQQRERMEELAREIGRTEAKVPARHGLLNRLAGWKLFGRGGGDASDPPQMDIRRLVSRAVANDAIVLAGERTRSPRVLIAVVTGLDAASLERILAVVGGSADRHEGAAETLCLTDCADFELFRRHRLVFEYLPPPSQRERFAPELDWDLYTLRRLARLRRKWNPVRIVAFGPTAQAQIALWRTSPFEDESITDLIGAPAAAEGHD